MAKSLVTLLILVSTQIYIGDEVVQLKAGSVHDIEPDQAAALLEAGLADNTPANVAFHSGDIDLYNDLVKAGGKKQKRKSAPKAGDKSSGDKPPAAALADADKSPETGATAGSGDQAATPDAAAAQGEEAMQAGAE